MSTVTTRIDNFIGGAFAAPVDGATEEIQDPATGAVIAVAPLSDASDVDGAVAAAAGAFDGWSITPPGERALALLRIADALEARGEPCDALRAGAALRHGLVNDHIPLVSELPHGGFKQSGYGKDMSAYSLEDYTELKHVMVSLG